MLEQLFGKEKEVTKNTNTVNCNWIYTRLPCDKDLRKNGWNCFACVIQGHPMPQIAMYNLEDKHWYIPDKTGQMKRCANVIAWHCLEAFDCMDIEAVSKIKDKEPQEELQEEPKLSKEEPMQSKEEPMQIEQLNEQSKEDLESLKEEFEQIEKELKQLKEELEQPEQLNEMPKQPECSEEPQEEPEEYCIVAGKPTITGYDCSWANRIIASSYDKALIQKVFFKFHKKGKGRTSYCFCKT